MQFKMFAPVAGAVLFAFASQALADSSVSNVTATLAASPVAYKGKCPAVITFKGTITVTGKFDPKFPVQIGYTFLRSDGATGPIKYYTLTAPGTTTVEETWTLGGPSLPTYSGWEQLKAWPTRHLGFGYAFSPKASFRVACAK